MQNIKKFLANLTEQPGVYQMLGAKGEVLYVGKARNLKKRVSSYFSRSQDDIKTAALLKHVNDIEVIITYSENEALLLESNLIKKYKPHYNILFRDDKSYPYILITTDQDFPRIDFYRGHRKKVGRYFGPYPQSSAVRETINLIQKLFHIRTCTDHFYEKRKRPCLLHQIGRCSGPCVELISKEEYQANVRHAILFLEGKNNQIIDELEHQMDSASKSLRYESAAKIRDQIFKLRHIQEKQYIDTSEGDIDVIGYAAKAGIVTLQLTVIRKGRMLGSRPYFPDVPRVFTDEEILSAFISQHYLTGDSQDIPKEILLPKKISDETWLMNALSNQVGYKVNLKVPSKGQRKKWIEISNENAKQTTTQRLTHKTNILERFEALRSELDFEKMPKRIECYDISHTMGEETVGSCVVFNTEGPFKSDYRRFNVRGIKPGNDIAAMEQVLFRRFQKLQNEEGAKPDILLIDGGVAQLQVTKRVLNKFDIKDVLVVGVAKGPSRKPGYETLYLLDEPPIHLPPDSIALHLIQQIRDEAHRFAITGHRMRRDKKRRTSSLESIPGIGAKRRRELLRYFGGIQALNHASLDELAKVPGISKALAEKIFEALHI